MSRKKTGKNGEVPKVGKTLMRLRQALKLSLGDLSESSGVSKSIISQIEKNESNPTLSTIYKLSNALDASVEEILQGEELKPVISKTPPHQIPVLRSEDGLCRLSIVNPVATVEWVQWYHFEAQAGGLLESSPHQTGCTEHLYVLDGQLRVNAGQETMEVKAGGILRYRGDLEHSIRNIGPGEAKATMVLVLKTFEAKNAH